MILEVVFETIFKIIVRPFFELLIWLTLYLTAWIITPILSFGFVRVEGIVKLANFSDSIHKQVFLGAFTGASSF